MQSGSLPFVLDSSIDRKESSSSSFLASDLLSDMGFRFILLPELEASTSTLVWATGYQFPCLKLQFFFIPLISYVMNDSCSNAYKTSLSTNYCCLSLPLEHNVLTLLSNFSGKDHRNRCEDFSLVLPILGFVYLVSLVSFVFFVRVIILDAINY